MTQVKYQRGVGSAGQVLLVFLCLCLLTSSSITLATAQEDGNCLIRFDLDAEKSHLEVGGTVLSPITIPITMVSFTQDTERERERENCEAKRIK